MGQISNGSRTEQVELDPSTGTLYFAETGQTTTGAGGLDPQDAPKLVGEMTGTLEATYGDVELSEFEEELRDREGLLLFHKMLTDSTITQVLNYQNAVMTNTNWRVVPASQEPEDLEIAAFVADQLGLNDMKAGKYSFGRLLNLFKTSRIYRRSYGELVFAEGPDGRFVLDKITPVHPFTVDKIEYDNKGGPRRVVQKGKVRGENGKQLEKKIPIWKMIVFTHHDDGVSEGESALRPALLHWRIKRALMILMNQGLERFSLGVPKITVPATVAPNSKEWIAARQLCIDYVTRPRMGVVMPQGYEFETVQINGNMPELIPYLEYHDAAIMRALGVEFSSLGAKEGVNVPVRAQMSMTAQSVQGMLAEFTSAINLYLIPKVVMINWVDKTRFPRLVADPEATDDMSAVANLFGMILNAAVDMTVADTQAKFQIAAMGTSNDSRSHRSVSKEGEGNTSTPQMGGKAGSVSSGGSRSGSGRTPSAKFGSSTDTDSLNFAEEQVNPALENLVNQTQAPGAFGDPEETAERVKIAMNALVSTMPTRLRRALGYLEDEQAQSMDEYRQSAQTVRKIDGRKPTPKGSG